MKKQLLWCMAALSFSAASAQTYETWFARPLSDVLNDVAARFQVRLKYDVDTVGRVLPYADFRIRPYSLEETLTNVLSPFDYKFVKQSDKVYKLKPYEYARRTDADGEKCWHTLVVYIVIKVNGNSAGRFSAKRCANVWDWMICWGKQ